MNLLLITNCTNRKRHHGGELLPVPSFGNNDLAAVAKRWWALAQEQATRVRPSQLYCGRNYQEALQAAAAADAPLYTVSAGFGLLAPDASIPPYDFSVADLAADGEKKRTSMAPAWWQAINDARGQANPIRSLLESDASVVVLALSSSYLTLIQDELLALPESSQARLRIVTAAPAVPQAIQRYVVPYDARLDGPDSTIRGTKSDFTSRALRHFIENVWTQNPTDSAEKHSEAVRDAMSHWRLPPIITRARKSDEEILALIAELWHEAKGSSARMLRLLRDQEGVACEQGRFAQLFREVKEARTC